VLRFIFGVAATGKTSKVLELIKNDAEKGKKAVLIIPEQFSFQSERSVLRLLGDNMASRVEVLSFSRICDAVERLTGGICGKNLSDADKLILMCRAIKQSADELDVFGRYKNSIGFARAMLETVDEFKTNSVTPDELLEVADKYANKTLSLKLRDIAIIYQNYDMIIGQEFIDPTDRLAKLYDRLLKCKYFENKTVYLDSFKGFTGQQFKIIDRILSQADDVYISFSCNSSPDTEFDLFSNIRKTVNRIKSRAEAYGKALGEDIVLQNDFYASRSIAAIEKLLSGSKKVAFSGDDTVTVCSADTVYDEAEFAARTIRRLVRENKDLRYRDIVIIARDTALYEEAVISACRKNGVFCFVDKRYPLADFPPVAATLAAIDAVNRFSAEAILRFYKTGIATIDAQELSKLENYTYIWNVDGKLWTKEWDMNPKGFMAGEISESDDLELQSINKTRALLITPFNEFKNDFKGNAKNRIKAILKLFSHVNAKKALKNMYDIYSENFDATYKDALLQSWDMLMSVFDSIADCLGDSDISTKEFTEILRAAVSCEAIGVAPQMLDEVTFGAADRIRPSRPKVAFILGANQNLFPKSFSHSGLLANSEREQLINSGIEISDHALEEAIDEEFLVYTNVCCPTERLFICYHNMDSEDKPSEPSAFVGRILENICPVKTNEPKRLDKTNLPETAESAFADFCKALGRSREDAVRIGAAVSEIPEYKEKIEVVKNGYSNRDMSISTDAAQKLFGNNIKISPSKLDVFMRCSFSYFCKYGLKAKKLQPAEFDVMQRGTIVHYVLERIVEDYKETIAEFSEDKISELVDFYINEYLNSIRGYKSVETARMRYLVFTISRSLKEVVSRLSKEFAQSKFKPIRCELLIGGDEVPSPEILIGENKKISVEGVVDRMDIWNGYVRIVDYKTGSRKFRLPDILVGQNMQMLIYLYAIVKKGAFADNKPAGIFYMPSRRDLNNTGMRMDGLAVENLETANAMESENAGEFVPPLKYNKEGEIHYHSKNSFIPETDFQTVFKHIENTLYKMGDKLSHGDFAVNPVDGLDSPACKYCDFASVCGIEDKVVECVNSVSNREVIDIIRKECE